MIYIFVVLGGLLGWAIMLWLVFWLVYGFWGAEIAVYVVAIILMILAFLIVSGVFGLLFGVIEKQIKCFISSKKNKAEAKEQERWNKEKARSRELWEEELHREITREEALAKVRNTSMIEMYKIQVDLMMKYKQEGANIDKDILAMREKLLVLEGQENKAMVQDLMDTLDRL